MQVAMELQQMKLIKSMQMYKVCDCFKDDTFWKQTVSFIYVNIIYANNSSWFANNFCLIFNIKDIHFIQQ